MAKAQDTPQVEGTPKEQEMKYFVFGRKYQTKGKSGKEHNLNQSYRMVNKSRKLLDDALSSKDTPRNIFFPIHAPSDEFEHLDQEHVYMFDGDPSKTHVSAKILK